MVSRTTSHSEFKTIHAPTKNQEKPVPCDTPPGGHSTLPGGSTQNSEQQYPLMRRLAVGLEPQAVSGKNPETPQIVQNWRTQLQHSRKYDHTIHQNSTYEWKHTETTSLT